MISQRIKQLLKEGNKVYWAYALISVAEITNVTEKGNVVLIDAKENKSRISVSNFEKSFNGIDILKYGVLWYESPDGTEYQFNGLTKYVIVERYYNIYGRNSEGYVLEGTETKQQRILRADMREGEKEINI